VSFLVPEGLVIIVLTLPAELGVTDLASTVKSVVESMNTPETVQSRNFVQNNV